MARGDNPLAVPVGEGGAPSRANRFDPLTMSYGVLYFGTDLETCFGETLARFRPSLEMLALVEDEWQELGFMAVGSVAADWRQRRTAVRVRLPRDLVFVDVESPLTHQFLRTELALGLSAMGLSDLDVSTVRGPERRVTQMISEWAYMASIGEDPTYGGIRYESRIRSGWECWALFDDDELEIDVLETRPITLDMPELQSVAKLFELQVF
ncbi:MAG TPA: RES family NAD+ phosphorylase [Acidimicrobiales bacterium]|nr:RES family NAD+ phosphorylase [Acidimicrobiales bacterium]